MGSFTDSLKNRAKEKTKDLAKAAGHKAADVAKSTASNAKRKACAKGGHRRAKTELRGEKGKKKNVYCVTCDVEIGTPEEAQAEYDERARAKAAKRGW